MKWNRRRRGKEVLHLHGFLMKQKKKERGKGRFMKCTLFLEVSLEFDVDLMSIKVLI